MDNKTRNNDVTEEYESLENTQFYQLRNGHAFDFWKSEDEYYAAIAAERDIQAHTLHRARARSPRNDSNVWRDNDSLPTIS